MRTVAIATATTIAALVGITWATTPTAEARTTATNTGWTEARDAAVTIQADTTHNRRAFYVGATPKRLLQLTVTVQCPGKRAQRYVLDGPSGKVAAQNGCAGTAVAWYKPRIPVLDNSRRTAKARVVAS